MPQVTHKRRDAITCVYFPMQALGMHVRFSYPFTKTVVGQVNMKQNLQSLLRSPQGRIWYIQYMYKA